MRPNRSSTSRRPAPTHAAMEDAQHRFTGTMGLLGLGLAVLAFLVAIDRPQWFHIRPATGTSIALSHAMKDSGQTPPNVQPNAQPSHAE